MRLPMFLVLLLLAAPAVARHGTSLVDVQIIDRETGTVLPVHPQRADRWIAGTPGHRYAVRLINRSGERVLAVLSVDGVNAISGETASTEQTGYVLGPWQQMEVNGWRKSLSNIAAFEFTSLGDSYAARTGRPDNVGVIGVVVFRERAPLRRQYDDAISREERAGRSAADRAPAPAAESKSRLGATGESARSAAPGAPLGTGHGEREWSSARHVAFERASRHPTEVHALRYDSHANLVALGILPPPRHRHRPGRPEPFPIGFVPDPY